MLRLTNGNIKMSVILIKDQFRSPSVYILFWNTRESGTGNMTIGQECLFIDEKKFKIMHFILYSKVMLLCVKIRSLSLQIKIYV